MFIFAICVGTIYSNVHVLTDGKLNSHRGYGRYIQTFSSMQSSMYS